MNIADFFKPSVAKIQRREAKKLELARKKEEQNAFYKVFENVVIFPGTKAEFETEKGYECISLDTGLRNDAGIVLLRDSNGIFNPADSYNKKILADQGMVGIVGARPVIYTENYWTYKNDDAFYGLPVGKKQ